MTFYRIGAMPVIVRHVLEQRGWRGTTSESKWNLAWKCKRFSSAFVNRLQEHQKVNHFPHSGYITKKASMIYTLKSLRLKYGSVYEFFPPAFIYSEKLKDIIQKEAETNDEIWICKPSSSSQGRGILITSDLSQIPLTSRHPLWIVQKYINDPHLINGYKYDLRLYALVTSCHPLTVYLYREGLVRLCTQKYTEQTLSRFRHLTNTSINKKAKDSLSQEELREFQRSIYPALGFDYSICKRTLSQLFSYFEKNGLNYMTLWNQIRSIIILTLLPLTRIEQKTPNNNCFELFGFDIILDSMLNPWLLEVNFSPALTIDSFVDQTIKEPLIHDVLNVLRMDRYSAVPVTRRSFLDTVNFSLNSSHSQLVGNFEQIFPFNDLTAKCSFNISQNIDAEYNNDMIVKEIEERLKLLTA